MFGPAEQPTLVLMNRNRCERPGLSPSNGTQRANGGRSWVNGTQRHGGRAATRCHAGRSVKQHAAILAVLEARSESMGVNVIDFAGTEPYQEQARAFYRAALVVGPHGAALANMIFCQQHASIIEFVSAHRNANSALYAAYSSVFGLYVPPSESPY